MSERTGLGPIEINVLESLHETAAIPDRPYVKTQRVLDALFDRHLIGPRIAYQVVCDLARPDVSHLRLVDFHGNYGSPDSSPASPRYTEVRLSRLGAAALEAEQGRGGALPIGLINGTTRVDGPTPPLAPRRLLSALRAATVSVSDDDLVDLVGLPQFPTGCRVSGDLEAFVAGLSTTLDLYAEITPVGRNELLISHLPPDVASRDVFDAIEDEESEQTRVAVHDVNDESTMADGTKIIVTLRSDVDRDAAIAALHDLWGVHTLMTVRLGDRLPDILRRWVQRHGANDLETRLAQVNQALTD